jgi:dienelactone hydrolase
LLVDRRTAIQSLAGASLGGLLDLPDPLQPGLCGSAAVSGFDSYCFTDSKGARHQVYVTGQGGPPVLLLHELPGLVDHDLQAARCVGGLGYRVVTPLFFGKPGRKSRWWTTALNSFRVCDDDEFACAEDRETSPIVSWLRELCAAARTEWPEGNGVGIIGMCLTGAFPVAMLQESSVVAAVLCQPTMPFSVFDPFGWFNDESALGLNPEDVKKAKNGSAAPLLGIRYTRDRLCRPPRFKRLAAEFGTRFYRMDLAGKGHSTLAFDFCPEAFDEVRRFLNQYLRTPPDPTLGPFPSRSKSNSPHEVRIEGCPRPTRESGCHVQHA